MSLRSQRRNNRLPLLLTLAGAALLLILLGRSPLLRPFLSGLMLPLNPAARGLEAGTEAAATLAEPAPDLEALQARTTELERTLAELQVEVVRLREIEQDYFRLSGLLNYAAEQPDQNLVTADVIARDTSSYLKWIILNQGTQAGIAVGDPVVTDLGLVGRVEEVAINAAWVRLIIDPGSAINGLLQTARAEGTLVGQLQGGLEMRFIPQQAALEPGDLVLTSGLGGQMPANIVIGEVTAVRRQTAALFQEAEVRPSVDFSQLDIAAVITDFNAVDTETFDEVIDQESQPEQ